MSPQAKRQTMWGGIGTAFAASALLVACGGDAPAPVAEAPEAPAPQAASSPAGGNRAPEILAVDMRPSRPVPGAKVTALVDAQDPDGDPIVYRYRWLRNGAAVGDEEDLMLLGAVKGDQLELEVVASDGQAESAPGRFAASVGNQAPRLYSVKLEAPGGVRIGQSLAATPDAQDPDGDEIRYEYEWRVNGDRRATGPEFVLADVRRGDEIVAVVVASDGRDESAPQQSAPARIGNSPPEIVSSPRWEESNGTFRYSVKAEDPDGDRTLRYRLREAPAGMQIDSMGGTISWTPDDHQVGQHKVEIEVDDLQGGKALQSVSVSIEMHEEEAEQPPARRRR